MADEETSQATVCPWRSVKEIQEEWDALSTEERIEEVLKAADIRDEWVDEITDRFIDDMPAYSSREAALIDNLIHSHREIAQFMRRAILESK